MTWIILQFVFLAMPVVLPALLYRSRRCFMARFYDKMVWSEKARRLYAHVLLIVLLLFHYVYTSGHPGEFGIVPSTIVCAAWASFRRADRWMRGLLDRPKRFVWFALLALVIGFVPHLYTMAVTINNCSFGCPVLPVGKGHVRKDRHTQIPRMAGMSRSISRQLS